MTCSRARACGSRTDRLLVVPAGVRIQNGTMGRWKGKGAGKLRRERSSSAGKLHRSSSVETIHEEENITGVATTEDRDRASSVASAAADDDDSDRRRASSGSSSDLGRSARGVTDGSRSTTSPGNEKVAVDSPSGPDDIGGLRVRRNPARFLTRVDRDRIRAYLAAYRDGAEGAFTGDDDGGLVVGPVSDEYRLSEIYIAGHRFPFLTDDVLEAPYLSLPPMGGKQRKAVHEICVDGASRLSEPARR